MFQGFRSERIPTEGAGPDDVAVAPDGSVWSTGFTGGQLGRIADGAYEVATTIEAGINPITIADDGTVVNIEDMAPQTTDSHCAAKPVRYALEMNQGWFAKRGIAPGSKLRGSPFRP